ncbi:TonB-dependent receptor plug domain-containing protein [Paucihalobacter sp.]|uniref:TonB-dependent receptor plug domain-containing protein n=1 Tax=Paucihalobacter sp. TaxID=2850405 RepID=UPI003D16113C
MTKAFIKFIFILIFCGDGSLKLQAQTGERTTLEQVLKLLEYRYDVRFSFNPNALENFALLVPNENLSLDEALIFIKSQVNVEILKLNDRFITVKAFRWSESFLDQTLDEVLITNYITSGISKKSLGSFNINPEKFGILPGLVEPDVLLILQSLPGITSTDESVSNLNIRGGTNDQNLIIFDGMKMYQSGHFFGLISAFNPYITKNVSVIKNGSSAYYGDGISSILNMQTSSEVSEDKTIGAGINMIYGDIFAELPINKNVEFQFAARRSITDLISTPTFNNYFERAFQDSDITRNASSTEILTQNENFYFYDVNAKLLMDLSEKDKINISFINFFNNVDYEESATFSSGDQALTSSLTQSTIAGSLTYNRKWSEKINSEAQLYLTNYDLDATNFDIVNNQRLIQKNEVLDLASKFNLNYKPADAVDINIGYQFNEVGITNLEDINNPVFRSFIKEVIRSHSAYAEGTIKFNNGSTILRAGGRLNAFQKFGTYLLEPRLGFSQRFANYFKFEILGEFKSQTTTQIIDLQNDFLGVEKRRWILSNNGSIPIVKSQQASAGVSFKKNKLFINFEGFYKEVAGITARSQAFQNQFQFITDVGGYTVKGAEFLINYQNEKFSSWMSYTYNDNHYKFDNINNGVPFRNNFGIEHFVNFGLNYSINHFKISSGVNWHSGLPITLPVAGNEVVNNQINFETPNNSTTSDYLRVDTSATYSMTISKKTKFEIGASVWNVFNTKNIINTYFFLNQENLPVKVENSSLGITPNFFARITL